jgi:hypothetical protein
MHLDARTFCRGVLALAALVGSTASPAWAKESGKDQPMRRPNLEETIRGFESLLLEIDKKHELIDASWPDRADAQREELPAPPAVQRLEGELGALEARKAQLLRELEWSVTNDKSHPVAAREPPHDLAPLLAALAKSKQTAFVDQVAPVVARCRGDDPRVFRALGTLASKHSPPLSGVTEGLARLESEDASMVLLDLGTKHSSLDILVKAGRGGHAAVLSRLIGLADGAKGDAALAQRAIERLAPPSRQDRREIEALVSGAIPRVRSIPVKTALIGYLGQFRNPANAAFFESLYHASESEPIRVAALSALGNLGAEGAAFFLEEIADDGNSTLVRRQCIHSLGAMRHRPAAPRLIALVGDPEFGPDAVRSLTRIAGKNLGVQAGPWQRWWRLQPEAKKAGEDSDRL